MKRIVAILALAVIPSVMTAQNNCPTIKSKDLQKRYAEACDQMETDQDAAIKSLTALANVAPDYYQATLILGNYYLEKMKDAQIRFEQKDALAYAKSAEKYLQQSFNTCNSYDSSRATFLLGECFYLSRKYDLSKTLLTNFINADNPAGSCIARAKKRLSMIDDYNEIMSNPIKFDSKILRDVSTKDDEFLPLISHDGTIMLYTRRQGRRNGTAIEELMMSTLERVDEEGEVFAPGIKMGSPFNMGDLQGGATLSIDNRIIYITICQGDDCDIHFSRNENGEWQPLVKLSTVNTEYFDGQPSIDPTGNVLYFASNRPGGYGGYDIYKVERKTADMAWSAPINLGSTINTEFDEKTPYMHCDGRTLYFSSNGHGGVGGFDIFHSRIDDSGKFTKPKNMGYPLNTESDEVAYVVSADGQRIYFSAKMLSGIGGWDIYCAELSSRNRPDPVVLPKGNPVVVETTVPFGRTGGTEIVDTVRFGGKTTTVYDEWRRKPSTEIEFIDYFKKKSGDNTGKGNKHHGGAIELEDINFDFNSSKLSDHIQGYLSRLAIFLNEYPQYNVELLGHTDGVGNVEANMALSNRRCNAVRNHLVKCGVNPKRITLQGFGMSSPMASNDTDKGRALNRRVELLLVKGE